MITVEKVRATCEVNASGCWEKIGVRSRRYGHYRIDGRLERAHRASWMAHHGEIPDGLYVCHRCNNKRCLSPEHLYLATHAQNIGDAARDGLMSGRESVPRGPTLVNALRTACVNGHPFDDENTYVYPSGQRGCRACGRQLSRASKRKSRTEARAMRAPIIAALDKQP